MHAIAKRNNHLEDGMTHAHAAAADWLALAARAPNDELRFTAMLEPLGHLAWDTEGAGTFPYADGKAEWNARAFVDAVEAEDEAAAIARARGALADGIPYAEMRPAFAEAAFAHYADFGHCAIYVLKAGQLIERLGSDVAEPLLLALTRMLVRATREERIPEFRKYADALKTWNGHGFTAAAPDDFVGLSIDAILERMLVSSARDPREVYDALLGAAAWNLLHFDLAVERATENAIADNVSWLDFTHALTFANACRTLCEERADLWPKALLQLALFVGRNKKYVTEQIDVAAWRVDDAAAVHRAGNGRALRSRPARADHRLSPSEGAVRAGGRTGRSTRCALGRYDVRRRQPLSQHADETPPRPAHRDTGTRFRGERSDVDCCKEGF